MDNVVQYNNHLECLDLHLSEITLNSYRGTLLEIIFARFFVLRARVLKEMRVALISQKRMVCWSAPAPAAEWSRLQKCWISFWNFRLQSNRKSSGQPHTWLLSGWPLCKNCEVSKTDLEAVILVWTSLISIYSGSARVFAADELNFISNISLNLVIFEFEPYNSGIWTL